MLYLSVAYVILSFLFYWRSQIDVSLSLSLSLSVIITLGYYYIHLVNIIVDIFMHMLQHL